MKKVLESIVGIFAGLALGLPQGMGELPAMIPKHAPLETLLTILVFGIVGGIAIGLNILFKSEAQGNYLAGYFFFLTGVLSIGITKVIKNYSGNYLESFNMVSMFFISAGIGMLIAGLLKFVSNAAKNT